VVVDVTDWEALRASADELEQRLGPVEIVVAAAAVAQPRAEVAALDPQTWRRVLEVNATGAFLSRGSRRWWLRGSGWPIDRGSARRLGLSRRADHHRRVSSSARSATRRFQLCQLRV
jgi:NAD(P)-dependent dehydrogenase (short-subunit alcohol dehydrogenase family)